MCLASSVDVSFFSCLNVLIWLAYLCLKAFSVNPMYSRSSSPDTTVAAVAFRSFVVFGLLMGLISSHSVVMGFNQG